MESDRLRVLHIDLERGWRGGEQQAAYLMRYLAELGTASVLAGRAGEPLSIWAAKTGVPTDAVGAWPAAGPRLARLVRERNIAVIHTHSSRSQNLGLLVRALCPAVRLVASRRVDFHRRRGLVNRWKYRTALVSRWVAISEKVRSVLIADGVPPERIAVIHSGIDPARIEGAKPSASERAELRRELGAGAGELLIGSVGALVPHKDRATLVRAMGLAAEQVPAARLVIAGEGAERPRLEGLISEQTPDGRVRLLGQREDVPRLLHALDLFVLSSREEGLGTSVLDAMAAGLPVIVTDAGGLPEMIRPGRNGLVVPARDPVALAQAIASMVQDEQLRAAFGRNNREDVARFSARRTAEETLALYRALL